MHPSSVRPFYHRRRQGVVRRRADQHPREGVGRRGRGHHQRAEILRRLHERRAGTYGRRGLFIFSLFMTEIKAKQSIVVFASIFNILLNMIKMKSNLKISSMNKNW